MRWLGRVKSWALRGHSSWSSWRVGVCERTGPSLYGVAGLSRRNFSKRKSEKKRHSVAIWGILQQQPLQPPPHPASKVVKKASSSHSRPWGECTTRRALSPHPRHQGEYTPQKAPSSHLLPRGECLPKPVGPEAAGELGWRLAECRSGTEKNETKPPSACCSQKNPAKLAWPV